MGMTKRERRLWLSHIKRIQAEQKQARVAEMREDAEYVWKHRSQESEG